MKSINADDIYGYEEVEHTADCALRIFGPDMKQLMLNAAKGMNSLLGYSLPEAPQTVERRFELEAIDPESLLVEWLSELAYLAESEMLVFDQIRIDRISPNTLEAVARGCRVHDLRKNIKAVTYHNLAIRHTAKGLETTVVFDV